MTFSFSREGITYRVHSEVGDGLAQVVIEEDQQQAPDMDCSEEVNGHG